MQKTIRMIKKTFLVNLGAFLHAIQHKNACIFAPLTTGKNRAIRSKSSPLRGCGLSAAIACALANVAAAVIAAQQPPHPPRWVHEPEALYPRSEWLYTLESGSTRREAEAAALASLAASFRVDIAALTKTSLASVQNVQQNGAKSVSQSADFHALAQEVNAASNVAGLIGIEKDFWTSPAGEVYALVRMNRAQCSARYKTRIAENEALIAKLEQAPPERAGTFDSYANLAFAIKIAELNDGFISILSVLAPEQSAYSPSYGGAASVKAKLNEAARHITANLDVKGDIQGRIEKAFVKVWTARGFRTGGAALYTLKINCTVEESPQSDGNFVYTRIVLSAALIDAEGKEIFAWSENDRQGHINIAGARERALSRAEALIAEISFAPAFDAWLASRLAF